MLCLGRKKDQAGDSEQIASSSAPLLGEEAGGEAQVVLDECNARFTNFNIEEEATCINSLTYLCFEPCWYYFVAPLLMLVTGLIFGLILFWYPNLSTRMFYRKVRSINEATHILVDGKMTKVPVVARLFSGDLNTELKDTFIFRFIKFQFDYES